MLGFPERLPFLEAPHVEGVPEELIPIINGHRFAQSISSIPIDDSGISTTEPKEEEIALQLNAMHVCSEGETEEPEGVDEEGGEEEKEKEEKGKESRTAPQRLDSRTASSESRHNVHTRTRGRRPSEPFPLGRRQYETMEKLLVTGSGMPWSDFDKVRLINVLFPILPSEIVSVQ